MTLERYVEQLSTDLRFEQAVEAKEDGSYSLRFEPGLDISLRTNAEGVIQLYAQLGPLPEVKRDEYLLKVMSANLFGRETGEAALGLDQEGSQLVLVNFLTENENYNAFFEKLEEFVNYADAWRTETREFVELKEEHGS